MFVEEAVLPLSCKEENNKNDDIDGAVFSAGNWNEDIEFVHNQGLMVDDDNKPAPMNVPMEQVSFAEILKIKVGDMIELIAGQLLFLLIKSQHSKVDGGWLINLLLRCSRRCYHMIFIWDLRQKHF